MFFPAHLLPVSSGTAGGKSWARVVVGKDAGPAAAGSPPPRDPPPALRAENPRSSALHLPSFCFCPQASQGAQPCADVGAGFAELPPSTHICQHLCSVSTGVLHTGWTIPLSAQHAQSLAGWPASGLSFCPPPCRVTLQKQFLPLLLCFSWCHCCILGTLLCGGSSVWLSAFQCWPARQQLPLPHTQRDASPRLDGSFLTHHLQPRILLFPFTL